MGLLRFARAIDDERIVFDESRLAGEGSLDERPDFLPSLAPDIRKGAAERLGFVAQNGAEAIIVDGNEVRSPDQGGRKGGIEHEGRRRFQCGRPSLYRPKWRPGPIELADAFGHLAVAGGPGLWHARLVLLHETTSREATTQTPRRSWRFCHPSLASIA
ncbi:hypothetical protein AA309_05825 [Microvirga vignae]|uniref:Uncharacterized protein n=1 Tax=Microvirga vignae TaxID=1225564 RepID=A0A0H1RGM9_9HYPH|nr:hypothetical protein AA309_05825 [Microvirga vignae]